MKRFNLPWFIGMCVWLSLLSAFLEWYIYGAITVRGMGWSFGSGFAGYMVLNLDFEIENEFLEFIGRTACAMASCMAIGYFATLLSYLL
jgi:hypothetical protein